MKRQYFIRIDQTDEHCTNALAANSDLEQELEEARWNQIRELELQRDMPGESRRVKTDKAAISAMFEPKAQNEDWVGILGFLQRGDGHGE
ncbi:hypothetical protein HG530_015783 [Fusarium avenaceum]|nr:hypothetical protein HG530_015783 [Fusarium avenaceum]KIL88430.1 hypothetical protein FAVG1_08510 [Fusarium avenaceum]